MAMINYHSRLYKMAVIILSMLSLLACTEQTPFFGNLQPPSTQVLRYLNAAEPRSIDPHKTDGQPEANIMLNIYEPLTTYDPKTLEPRPGMAESWESVDQARKWIFHLRKNAIWTDSHPVVAQDFVWAWQRGVTPETAAPSVSLLFYIHNGAAISNGKLPPSTLGVRAIDNYTLEVEMEQPTAFFAKMTSNYIFAPLPRWAIEKWGDKWTDPDKIVTNGPFRLLEHLRYSRVVLVRNPDYWDAAKVKLEKAIFYPIGGSTGMNLYKAGEVDVMITGMIPLPFLKLLSKKQDYFTGPLLATQFYSINVKKKPFDDVRVRQALNMSVDKKAITDQLIGKGDIPATTYVPPGIVGYPVLKGPEYNPAQARKLLAEAGYFKGQGFPTITIYFNSDEVISQTAEAIQQMWKKELNINVELQSEEWQTFAARQERRDFDIMRRAWNGDYLDASTFLDCFASDTGNNSSGWTKPEYTRLLALANAEPDGVRRTQLLMEAEQLLIDDMPIIPLYYNAFSYLKKPYINGWYSNLIDTHPLKYVSVHSEGQADNPIIR